VPHHHFIECNLFSPWYTWKKWRFCVKQQSLTHSFLPREGDIVVVIIW